MFRFGYHNPCLSAGGEIVTLHGHTPHMHRMAVPSVVTHCDNLLIVTHSDTDFSLVPCECITLASNVGPPHSHLDVTPHTLTFGSLLKYTGTQHTPIDHMFRVGCHNTRFSSSGKVIAFHGRTSHVHTMAMSSVMTHGDSLLSRAMRMHLFCSNVGVACLCWRIRNS